MTDKIDILGKIDTLTGIYNRQFWEEQLPLELERSQTTKKPVSIAIIDLDNFRLFNTDRGFQAGDDFLCQVTQRWKQQMRRIDMLIRYGGQEFALILPGCEPENAVRLLDRLRNNFPDGETFSAGVATWNTQESCEEFVKRAFEALYKAKDAGKNQTAIAC